MESSDNNSWVFDSLVGFLHGPVWNVPLQTFIEEKSLRVPSGAGIEPATIEYIIQTACDPSMREAIELFAFEPTDAGEVTDRPEYKAIHNEYRNLVDAMLGSFMDDIGITADQFEAACRMSARDLAGLPAHFHRRLFEQIWAANDYEMFVKMMTHKNVELQLQALELIERRFGTMPNIFSSGPDDLDTSRSDESEEWLDNDDVMTEIKKLHLEDSDEKDDVVNVPPEDVVVEKKSLLSKLQSFQSFEKKEEIGAVKKTEPPKPAPKKVEVSEEEMRSRQEYLKQQRDKLLALKKQVRERRLDAADSVDLEGGQGSRTNFSRPKSAKMAQAALAGATPAPPPDAMQLRRALASKLKTEVVDTTV